MKHYDFEISQFIDNELSPNEQKELFLHLSGCEECRNLLSDFRGMKKDTGTYYNNLSVELKPSAKLLASNTIKVKRNIYKPLFYMSVAASIILAMILVWNGKNISSIKQDNYNKEIIIAKQKEVQNTMKAELQKNITAKYTRLKSDNINQTKKTKNMNYNYTSMQVQYLKYLKSVKTINLTSADILNN